MVCQEGTFPDIFWLDLQVMVAIANVELCEQVAASKSVNQLRYKWEWIVVLDSPFVELAVVIYWSKLSTFLLDKEEWCCVWALRWSYVSFGFLFLDMLFQGFVF